MKRFVLALCAVLSSSAGAQTVDLWPGTAPGSEKWTLKEVTYENTPVGTVVQNVVTPTITAYLPAPSKATGAGVIVAPGGAFVALATSKGGVDVAKWLQERGIAAFLLKYRTVQKSYDGMRPMDMDTAGRYGIADGIQALKVVRAHASEWKLSPKRIGMIGFSAGAMVVSGAVLQPDAALRPSFAAMIYGAPFGVMPKIPSALPPLFLSWASDDPVALAPVLRFHDTLAKAGIKTDTHVYATGGHGFGIEKQGKASDAWSDAYYAWLQSVGATKRAAAR